MVIAYSESKSPKGGGSGNGDGGDDGGSGRMIRIMSD